jgi:hypothetical protein
MSDSYRPRDVKKLIKTVESIIERRGDPGLRRIAIDVITAVMEFPSVAEGFHLQGYRAYDIDDILACLQKEVSR